MSEFQPYLDYFAAHPAWALIFVFLIAFGEALLVVGLLVPSTVALIGAGTLVGAGTLEFWPIFIATILGAVLGDQLSYWLGRYYGQSLRTMWPLSRHKALLERSEEFVRKHGGTSIAIGRFVPGVKAVIPGIVGMLRMNQAHFLIINILSAVVWSAVHLLPGVLIGQGLSFAGDLSGRLLVLLVLLLVSLGLIGWSMRLIISALQPFIATLQVKLSHWSKTQNSRVLHRFGRAIAPENSRSVLIVFFISLMLIGGVSLGVMTLSLITKQNLPNGDVSAMTLMAELRNAPADQFMIPLSMMGDGVVLASLGLVTFVWLLWHQASRAALAAAITLISGLLVTWALSSRLTPPEALAYYQGLDQLSFFSVHETMTAITFGVATVLVSHSMRRWARASLYGIVSVLIGAIAFADLYLGIQWLSGTVAGLLFALVLVCAFAVAIEGLPPRRIRALGLLTVLSLTFVSVSAIHIDRNLPKAILAYAKPRTLYSETEANWRAGGWRKIPAQRIDLVGRLEEPFSIQWAAGLQNLRKRLEPTGWRATPRWTWGDALNYLSPSAGFDRVAPRPSLHEGLQARLTLVKDLPGTPPKRLVLRAYRAGAEITGEGGTSQLFLVSVVEETLLSRLHSYVMPIDKSATSADEAEVGRLLAEGLSQPAKQPGNMQPLLVFQPQK